MWCHVAGIHKAEHAGGGTTLRNNGSCLLYYTLSLPTRQQASQSVLSEHYTSGMRSTQGIYNIHGHEKNTKTWLAEKQYSE